MKILFDQILLLLNLRIRLCDAMRNAAFMQQSSRFHGTIHCTDAHLHTVLPKCGVHSADSVIVIVLVFGKNDVDFDQKKLLFCWFIVIFEPSVITRFADFQHAAHLFYGVNFLEFQDEQVAFAGFYFFRSFAKKPSASFNISFA